HAVGITEVIDPGSLIDTGSRYYERVAVPPTSRISPPSREIGIYKRLTPVGPDGTKAISPFEVLIQPVGENNELHRIGIDQSPRRSHGIAILIRIRTVGRRYGSASPDVFFRMCGSIGAAKIPAVGRFVRIELLLTERSERRHVVSEAAISTVSACATATVSARASVSSPEARKVVLIERLVRILWIGGGDSALSALC